MRCDHARPQNWSPPSAWLFRTVRCVTHVQSLLSGAIPSMRKPEVQRNGQQADERPGRPPRRATTCLSEVDSRVEVAVGEVRWCQGQSARVPRATATVIASTNRHTRSPLTSGGRQRHRAPPAFGAPQANSTKQHLARRAGVSVHYRRCKYGAILIDRRGRASETTHCVLGSPSGVGSVENRAVWRRLFLPSEPGAEGAGASGRGVGSSHRRPSPLPSNALRRGDR